MMFCALKLTDVVVSRSIKDLIGLVCVSVFTCSCSCVSSIMGGDAEAFNVEKLCRFIL